jgi:tetratricopeptide (TPR) repeat protein
MKGLGIAAPALVVLSLTAGCETQERIVPGSSTTVRHAYDEQERETREDVLRQRTKDEPEDPKAWFDLGTYYEDVQQFGPAIACYEQLYGLMKQEQSQTGTYYTAGAYHLGRAHARARNYREAVQYLRELLDQQPKDPVEASLNSHFREAHYLLGAVYYENRQWKPSRQHFVSFRELGGEPLRVEPWLARIDEVEHGGTIRARRGEQVDGAGPSNPPPSAPAAPLPQ